MVENVSIWGRKQHNWEEKLQFWATNPEIADIFHSSAKKFFGSGAVFFPKPEKAVLLFLSQGILKMENNLTSADPLHN